MTDEQRKELYSIRERYITHLKKSDNNNQTIQDLKKLYPPTDDQNKLIEQVDDLRKCLDSFRPFDKFQLKNLEDYYAVSYTYESNRIEGNTLTQNETHLVINKGMTVQGKPMKDHLEAINHKEAYEYIVDLAKNKVEINEREVLRIHALILRAIDKDNAGQYRGVNIKVGESAYVFPQPFLVPKLMEDYFIWYNENKEKLHPVLLAGEMHSKLVTIHPFIDGNGRTSRLVMNLILLQHGYPLVNISGEKEERQAYYDCLQIAQTKKDYLPFLNYVLTQEKQSLFEYIRMFSGNVNLKEKGYHFYKTIEKVLR